VVGGNQWGKRKTFRCFIPVRKMIRIDLAACHFLRERLEKELSQKKKGNQHVPLQKLYKGTGKWVSRRGWFGGLTCRYRPEKGLLSNIALLPSLTRKKKKNGPPSGGEVQLIGKVRPFKGKPKGGTGWGGRERKVPGGVNTPACKTFQKEKKGIIKVYVVGVGTKKMCRRDKTSRVQNIKEGGKKVSKKKKRVQMEGQKARNGEKTVKEEGGGTSNNTS